MNNGFDPKHSLTGNEFLDFLSWCEVQGIDFEGNEEQIGNTEEENQNDYNDENNGKLIYRKEKGRDKYE